MIVVPFGCCHAAATIKAPRMHRPPPARLDAARLPDRRSLARRSLACRLRPLAALVALALLSACASHTVRENATIEAAQYAARARPNYMPPGPPEDPWGPYIIEAATRFDVPETWIRGVMRQESGGRLYEDGQLITSPTGAMGLMQVEPYTYDELRSRYSLGNDPYDPHENILAGAAYMRELYDAYGSPAFLAAYNAGPGRLDQYLANKSPLPAETRHYVAAIAPGIIGAQPQRVSGAQMVAMNQIPIDIPAGNRYPPPPRFTGRYALVRNRNRKGPRWVREPVMVASLPEPPPPHYLRQPEYSQQYAANTWQRPPAHGFHLIPRAAADTLPERHGGPASGDWAIQVGAFGNAEQARAAAASARGHAGVMLASAHAFVGTVHQGRAVLYRARLTGLSRETAVQACERLSHKGCMVLSPNAQS